jgi:hypothetical protein
MVKWHSLIPVHQPRAGPSAFVDGVDANFLLLDIPFDKFGNLLGFIPSLEFIPERLVKRCRRAYTFVMEHLLNNKNNGEAALVWWKKFLLLPFVLFSPSKKSEINRRLGLVLDNQWPFTLSDFDMQKQRFHNGNLDNLAMFSPTDRKAYRYLQNGMIAKAFDVLCNKNPPVSASEVVYEKLKSKHPNVQLRDSNNESVSNDIRNFEVDPEDKIIVVAEDLLLSILGLKSCVKPGIDKLRNKHLQQMV